MGKATIQHKKNKKELQPLYQYLRQTEKRKKQEYEQFLETFSQHLAIPQDVLAGQPVLSMTGTHSLHISNYRSIEEYSTKKIRLSFQKRILCIRGDKLSIEYFRKEEIKIVGNISNISFE